MDLSAIKLGNLDPIDLKSGIFTLPGGIPLSLSVVESVYGVRIHIVPWLAANIIRKVRVGTTDSNVKYNEEFSIEGGSVVFTNPGVVKAGRELASLEEALCGEVNLEDLIAFVINIGV